jgi:hypothetical protein
MPECNASHPRIFIYPDSIGTPPWNMQYDARLDFLAARIRSSQFYTADGSCADYFIVHNYVGQYTSSAFVLRTFERIAQSFPHWNRTHQTGLVRHLVISPCDHGPGDCMFDRNGMPALSAGGVVPWSALDPLSARRRTNAYSAVHLLVFTLGSCSGFCWWHRKLEVAAANLWYD